MAHPRSLARAAPPSFLCDACVLFFFRLTAGAVRLPILSSAKLRLRTGPTSTTHALTGPVTTSSGRRQCSSSRAFSCSSTVLATGRRSDLRSSSGDIGIRLTQHS